MPLTSWSEQKAERKREEAIRAANDPCDFPWFWTTDQPHRCWQYACDHCEAEEAPGVPQNWSSALGDILKSPEFAALGRDRKFADVLELVKQQPGWATTGPCYVRRFVHFLVNYGGTGRYGDSERVALEAWAGYRHDWRKEMPALEKYRRPVAASPHAAKGAA